MVNFEPFTSSLDINLPPSAFESPKNVIKARDPRLALIDVAVPGFLAVEPPSTGTQGAQLLAPLATRMLYSQEQPLPVDEEAKKPPLNLSKK